MYILNYNCVTAAGFGAAELMKALYAGRDCSSAIGTMPGYICRIPESDRKPQLSYRENFKNLYHKLWNSLQMQMSSSLQQDLKRARVALVFASTKGIIEDYIWTATAENIRTAADPFQVVIEDFCRQHSDIDWQVRANISNACASSHVACEYIQSLFRADRADYAVLLAGDLMGSFITKGFAALKIISPTGNRPFSGDREGLQLGDAATIMLFAKSALGRGIAVEQVESDTEGSSITRPSVDGKGLRTAIDKVLQTTEVKPDLVVAHGTGTHFNDLAEELALTDLLSNDRNGDDGTGASSRTSIPVTGLKWCIGHTLGASGCVDMIAACEILKNQRLFRIQNTQAVDPQFKMNYLIHGSDLFLQKPLHNVMVNSLGFGGVHASLMLRMQDGGGL